MPVGQFMDDADISPFNKNIVRAALDSDGIMPSAMPGMPPDPTREYFLPGLRNRPGESDD